MKRKLKKIQKELWNFVSNEKFDEIHINKSHELVTQNENGIWELTVKTVKEHCHPFDQNRFDFEQVGDYDGKWYYKGTKNEVSKKHLHSWLDEFEYVDVPADQKEKLFNINNVFRVYPCENKEDITIQLNGTYAELYDYKTEFYSEEFERRLNQFLTACGFTWYPYDDQHIRVEI